MSEVARVHRQAARLQQAPDTDDSHPALAACWQMCHPAGSCGAWSREPYGEEEVLDLCTLCLNIPGPLSWHQMAFGEGGGKEVGLLGGAKLEEVGQRHPGWADWPAGRAQNCPYCRSCCNYLGIPCPGAELLRLEVDVTLSMSRRGQAVKERLGPHTGDPGGQGWREKFWVPTTGDRTPTPLGPRVGQPGVPASLQAPTWCP